MSAEAVAAARTGKNCWTCEFCSDPPACDALGFFPPEEDADADIVEYVNAHCDIVGTTGYMGMPMDDAECPRWVPVTNLEA